MKEEEKEKTYEQIYLLIFRLRFYFIDFSHTQPQTDKQKSKKYCYVLID